MTVVLVFDFQNKPKNLKGGFARIAKRTLNDAGKFWHTTMLPKHFKAGNRSEYKFDRREQEYLKDRREGKVRGAFGYRSATDLVLKGRSQRAVENLETIRGTSKRVTVTMHAPGYFSKKVSGQPDKKREVEEFSGRDIRAVKRFIGKRINRLVAKQFKNPSQRVVV